MWKLGLVWMWRGIAVSLAHRPPPRHQWLLAPPREETSLPARLYVAGRSGDKAGNPRETLMARTLPRLAALAALAFAGAAAFGQAAPQGPPSGTPGGNAPPGGLTAGVTGNTPSIADQ